MDAVYTNYLDQGMCSRIGVTAPALLATSPRPYDTTYSMVNHGRRRQVDAGSCGIYQGAVPTTFPDPHVAALATLRGQGVRSVKEEAGMLALTTSTTCIE